MKKQLLTFLIPCTAFLMTTPLVHAKKLNMDYAASIRECVTTESDLKQNLGKPTVENDMGTYKQLIWQNSSRWVNPFNPQVKVQMVNVYVERDGKVLSVNNVPTKNSCR